LCVFAEMYVRTVLVAGDHRAVHSFLLWGCFSSILYRLIILRDSFRVPLWLCSYFNIIKYQ